MSTTTAQIIRAPLRLLLGGTLGATFTAVYLGYSTFTHFTHAIDSLDERVTVAEERIEKIEQKVEENDERGRVRMEVLESRMAGMERRLGGDMEVLRMEVQGLKSKSPGKSTDTLGQSGNDRVAAAIPARSPTPAQSKRGKSP